MRCVLIFSTLLLTSSVLGESTRPNIVFLLADDLGIGDVGCYGGDLCRIDTPHIDALAAGGLRFTDAHANAAVCIPTRVAIMTGRYPWRYGPPQPGGAWGLLGPRFDPSQFTLGKMFQDAGYRTGYVGKWHLGTVMATKDGKVQNETNVDYTLPLAMGPLQYGFDDSFILPGSLDMYPYAFARNHVWQGTVTAQKGWSAFNRIGPAEQEFQDHEVLETFYREAESFIDGQCEQPFFLYLALTAPHTPTSPGKAFQGRSQLGVYGDFVMQVDHGVDRILRALQRNDVYRNTLVILSSDHGAGPYAGNILKATPGQIRLLEKRGHFSSGPHRGYKFSVYEGGLRVPLIAHWPDSIQPGTQCDALVGLCDLMATLAEVTGAEIEPHHAPDSISFAPLLQAPQNESARTNLIMQSTQPYVVRDGKWKLCICPGSGANGSLGNTPAMDEAWRRAVASLKGAPTWPDLLRAPFVQLFDMSVDPHEDHNLAASYPERVRAMVQLLRGQIQEGRSNPGPALNPDRQFITLLPRVPKFVRSRLSKASSMVDRRTLLQRARRIVFLGDSITYSGQYVAAFDAWLSTPESTARPTVINVGLSSETVSGLSEEGHAGGRFPRPDLAERLDRVLRVTRPDLVFACYGINCGIYQPFDEARFARFQLGIQRLRNRVIEAGAELVLITPPTFDDQRGKRGFSYNAVLDRYSDWLVAQRQHGWPVIDLHKPMTAELNRRREVDPEFTFQPDAVHPSAAGHWYIASQLFTWFGDNEAASADSPAALLPGRGSEIHWPLIRQRMELRRDAYLSAAGHTRPGVKTGLPIKVAELEASAVTLQIEASR